MNKAQTWEYSPAPESTDHIQLKDKYDLFINGKFVPGSGGKTFDSINPANEKTIAIVAAVSYTHLTLPTTPYV